MSIEIKVDLCEQIGPARDQEQRPTCIAFATSAAHEVHRSTGHYLSVEYLFHSSVQLSHKDPARGVSSESTRVALLKSGQPDESVWPYLTSPLDVTSWSPPVLDSPSHKAEISFTGGTVDETKEWLSAQKPVVLITQMTIAMHKATSDGIIRLQGDDISLPSYHALLALGYGAANDGEYILARNSWGTSWGDRGHAWLHADYLAKWLWKTGKIA
jgi:hypothetical protein